MNIQSLCGAWKGKCIYSDKTNFEFNATVPGSAINDLVNANRLPKDLFWRKNADAVQEFEKCDYVYKKSFDYSGKGENVIIRFERIDTYADVFLNGNKVHHSENGNIRHDIDVSGSLVQGENILEVHLYSPSEWVKDRPHRNGAFTTERLHTRRMQCTYGWDWVARFLTCGLGECSLIVKESADIYPENVYIATMETDEESATVRVDISFEREYEGRVFDFEILSPDKTVAAKISKYSKESFVRLDFDIPNPELWYPIGYGEQPIYTFVAKQGERVVYTEDFGIRTVKIMQLPDAPDSKNYEICLSVKDKDFDLNETFSGFVLKVNGKKIFCKGANWVPCVPYDVGNVDKRQTEILELCVEAGVNMLRIWGGGAFETRHFYSECSRLGIMVTQDFLMACGSYPEKEEWFIKELNKEAEYAVSLCRNQPCLMWWTGDNENAVRGCDTDENYTGRSSAYEGIAPVLYQKDPYRRFLPSSPYGGKKYASNTVGTTHNTMYLGRQFEYFEKDDLSDYKEELKKFRARFIAEEPQFGAISTTSLRRFMEEEDIYGDNDELWLYHTKNNTGLKEELLHTYTKVARKIMGDFTSPQDRVFKLRYLQFEWIRVVMEQARREKDFCSGLIFWMMNDCWPAASGWAIIDFYNLPKDSFYSFKRCAKPVLATITEENGKLQAFVVNEHKEKPVTVSIKILSADKKSVKEYAKLNVIAQKESSNLVFEENNFLAKGEVLICEVESEFGFDRAFYRQGGLEIEPTSVDFQVDKKSKTIKLSAKEKYVHAATVSGNAVFEDNCFSLLPGESRIISYRVCEENADDSFLVEGYTLT